MSFCKKYQPTIVYIITILFSIIYIFIGNKICSKPLDIAPNSSQTQIAKVTKIVDVILDEFSISEEETLVNKTIVFEAVFKSGPRKGETFQGTQQVDPMFVATPKDIEVADNIVVFFDSYGEEIPQWFFGEYHRSNILILLCVLFFGLLLLFGRRKGLNTIVSLVFTCLAIFMVFVPSVLSSFNIYLTSSITCLFIIFMTLLIINGANTKTFCAAIGCLGGLSITAILTLIMDKVMHLTGFTDQDSQYLLLLNEENPINLRAIIFGAIVIGAMGATMDVSMSISSSLKELSDNMHDRTYKKLLKSGLNIGRDIMGTMANTLILAYIGSSLSVVLLLVANTGNMLNLFNLEMIVVEVMQALVGSLGILFTIPITSILASFIYNREKSKPVI